MFTQLLCTHQLNSCLQATVLLHLLVFPAHTIRKESLSWSSIQDTYFLHWHFPFCFHFFGCFMRYISRWCIEEWLPWFLARLEVNLMTLRVVTFLTPFSHVDVISALSMHPVMLSSLAVFLTSNNCHDRRHHTNHPPFFFFQWKFYCLYSLWCFVCFW